MVQRRKQKALAWATSTPRLASEWAGAGKLRAVEADQAPFNWFQYFNT
jgi:hypothetical protein